MAETRSHLPPLEWIRVFEAAGRTGSFTAAAGETGLIQAAVSQRIKNLEASIGARLFDRQARGVTLTVAGEAWLPDVTETLQTLEQSTRELFEKPLKRIKISSSASVIQLWLIPRLGQFYETTPGYHLSFETVHVEPDFKKADAQVEIRYGQGNWPGVRAAQMYQEALVPCISPRLEGGTEKSLADLPLIAVSGPRPGWQYWSARTGVVTASTPTLRFDSYVQALAAASAGQGVILGSVPLCTQAFQDGTLVPIGASVEVGDQGYWLTSDPKALPQRQWQALVAGFCEV